MEKKDFTLEFPDKEKAIRGIIGYYTPLLEVLTPGGVIDSPNVSQEQKEEYKQMYSRLREILDSWEEAEKEYLSPDTPEKRKKEIYYSVEEWYLNFYSLYYENKETPGEVKTIPSKRIVIDPETGERSETDSKTHLWGDMYLIPGKGIMSLHPSKGGVDLLAELDSIRDSAKGGVVKISKDLWKSQIDSKGDSLEFIKDEKIKRSIQKKRERGELIGNSTLLGLTGGSVYFKVFCLAIAQTLWEQSKHFHTEDTLSGIPKELLLQYVEGEGLVVEDIKMKPPTDQLKGGQRPFPIIILMFEDTAKKMSSTGEISGGKDIKVVREYVLGGKKTIKDKTGVVREIVIPGLLGREYLVQGANGKIIGIPFMHKLLSIYSPEEPDKAIGVAVQISPLFAFKNLIGYTGIRPDTIQLLGGGKQREITLNLFIFLAYYRNVPEQKGRKKGEFVQRKKQLLGDLSKGLSSYSGRPGLLEKHYREAVLKCIDAKILLSGTLKGGGLKGYREERNPGGEILSVFTYNPDYLKGEEITLFSGVDEQ